MQCPEVPAPAYLHTSKCHFGHTCMPILAPPRNTPHFELAAANKQHTIFIQRRSHSAPRQAAAFCTKWPMFHLIGTVTHRDRHPVTAAASSAGVTHHYLCTVIQQQHQHRDALHNQTKGDELCTGADTAQTLLVAKLQRCLRCTKESRT